MALHFHKETLSFGQNDDNLKHEVENWMKKKKWENDGGSQTGGLPLTPSTRGCLDRLGRL